MTEEAKPTAPAPTPTQETAPTPQQAPQAPAFAPSPGPVVWCKGGTTTSRFDAEVARAHAEAEARRKELDEDKRTVREEGAKMYSYEMAGALDPKVVLHYDDSKLGVRGDMLCELVEDEVSGDRILCLVCLDCISRGIPSDAAQMIVRDSHRAWHLDTKHRGEPGRYVANGQVQIYIKAGSIAETDTLRCSAFNCTYAIKISNDQIRRV